MNQKSGEERASGGAPAKIFFPLQREKEKRIKGEQTRDKKKFF